jgi:hypothetical protein
MLFNWVRVSFTGVKRPERDGDKQFSKEMHFRTALKVLNLNICTTYKQWNTWNIKTGLTITFIREKMSWKMNEEMVRPDLGRQTNK